MGECEVQKAELKEALVLKFEGINFGVIDLEKARALRDELNSYFDRADGTITLQHASYGQVIPSQRCERECSSPLVLNVKVNGVGPATLQGVVYDPLLQQSEFVFTL